MADFNYDSIDSILARAESLFRRRFMQAVREIRDSQTLNEIERLLTQGRIAEAFTQAELAATNLSNAYVTAYLMAADDVMAFMSDAIGITVRFDQVNFRAVEQMQSASLRLIQEFTSGQRRATRAALVEGIRLGINPREQAQLFRQSIGLTEKQLRAVANYRRLLQQGSAQALQRALRDRRFDATVQRAVTGGAQLTEDQIEKMVERYYQRSLTHRAETIARTESLTAVHQGSDRAFQQAIEQGLIDDDLSQVWHTAKDARVRHPAHTAMEGQVRALGEFFISGAGNRLRYPGDPAVPASERINCRCTKSTQFSSDVLEPVQ